MKKFKILTPMMAAVCAATPVSVLASCSCSDIDYTGITKAIKEDAMKFFNNLEKEFRPTWDCSAAYDFIKTMMKSLGFEPTWSDHWSEAAYKDGQAVKGTYGNIWYDIPASEGYEHYPKVMLSGFYDMDLKTSATDPVKEAEIIDKVRQNGIQLELDEENQKLHTKDFETTAGFSDGVGVCAMIAIAKNHEKFGHGPIRLMFTADSGDSTKTYASGSDYLKHVQYGTTPIVDDKNIPDNKKPFDTPYVINTDGQTQADITISSAGIHQCSFGYNGDKTPPEQPKAYFNADELDWSVPYSTSNPNGVADCNVYTLKIDGLTGGNSGVDINKGRGNAIKLMSNILTTSNPCFRIIDFDTTQNNGYTIAQDCTVKFILQKTIDETTQEDITTQKIQQKIDTFKEAFENVFLQDKGKTKIVLTKVDSPSSIKYALDRETTKRIFAVIGLINYGPYVWFDDEHTQVKTSCNIGPLRIKERSDIQTDPKENRYSVSCDFTARSANANQLYIYSQYTHTYLKELLKLKEYGESETNTISDYITPVWENTKESYKVNNKMSLLMQEAYKRFKYTPKEANSHGWLDVSTFVEPIEELKEGSVPYIATIGPTISEVQTPKETLYISTVNSCIRVALYVLHNSKRLEELK